MHHNQYIQSGELAHLLAWLYACVVHQPLNSGQGMQLIYTITLAHSEDTLTRTRCDS